MGVAKSWQHQSTDDAGFDSLSQGKRHQSRLSGRRDIYYRRGGRAAEVLDPQASIRRFGREHSGVAEQQDQLHALTKRYLEGARANGRTFLRLRATRTGHPTQPRSEELTR